MYGLNDVYKLVVSTLISRYTDALAAPSFLFSLFELNYVASRTVDIEVTRALQLLADDVLEGEQGHYNTQTTKNLKKFYIPGYKEKSVFSPLFQLMNLEFKDGADVMMTEDQVQAFLTKVIYGDADSGYVGTDVRINKILRSYEKLCAMLLFKRAITFVNNVQIDFFPKAASFVYATENANTATAWSNADHDSEKDFVKAIEFTIEQGNANNGNRYMAIGQSSDFADLLRQKDFVDNKFKYTKNVFAEVGMNYLERVTKSNGGMYQGTIQVGGYIVDLWAYNATYDSKTSPGTKVKYVPTNNVLILPIQQSGGQYADMQFTFGAHTVKQQGNPGAWLMQKGDFGYSMIADDQAEANVSSITSSGIPTTSSIDRFATIITTGTRPV